MKKILLLLPLFALMLTLTGCTIEPTSDQVLGKQQETLMKQAADQVGMPAIKNFQERKLAKQIMELRDQANLVTYSYVLSMQGKMVLLCKSIGYGLPYSVQYTSPQKVSRSYDNDGLPIGTTLPQADPNGLYMPEGLSATWVMCIDPSTNKPTPVYVESDVTVSTFPLSI